LQTIQKAKDISTARKVCKRT